MTFSRYRDVLLDAAGNIIVGGSVAVVLTGTSTPARLYNDAAGASLISGNAVLSNSTGEFGFYAAPGIYDLVVTAAGYSTVTRTGVLLSNDWLSPLNYGADPTGMMDSRPAFLAALAYAYANRNKTIRVDSGSIFRLNGSIQVARGVMLMCEGSAGSSEASGTVFKHYGNGDCFVFDGSGTDNQGTGGGLQNALIVKAGGFSGGDALKIITTSDAKRPGEMVCENILSYGVDPAVWTAGRYVYVGDNHFGAFLNNCYRVYVATTEGPTGNLGLVGTGAGISDGAQTWNYLRVMTAGMHTPGATYLTGDIVRTGANRFYIVTTPGVAGVTTPTGTGTGISDGTVIYNYHSDYVASQGLWGRGLNVDGTATNTPGARGVRHLHMRKCRFAEVTTAGECVLINQVSHFYAQGLATDVGSGVSAGMTIKGINDGINIHGMEIGGAITIVANDASNQTNNLNISGSLASAFTCNDNQLNGTADMVFSDSGGFGLINKAKSFKIRSNINPAFMLKRVTPQPSTPQPLTGDGTLMQVQWDAEVFDKGNNFTFPGTPTTFTCVCAGVYSFEASVTSNVAAANVDATLQIAQAGSVSRALIRQTNPYAVQVSGYASLNIAGTFELAYGDTVIVSLRVLGSAANSVGVYGGAGSIYSWLSGKYHGA